MKTSLDRVGGNARSSFLRLLELIALTVLFLCILFRHFFDDPFYYFASDLSELYYPYWAFINQSLHSGAFPLLNPFWFAGALPFFPLETSVFYPPLLFAQLLFDARRDLDYAFVVLFAFQLFHYVLASVNFYLLARVGLRLNRTAAVFGSLVFCCSGAFVGHFVHIVYFYTLPWLPLLFLFYILFLRHRTLVYAVATAAVLALVIVAGHPQFVLYTFGCFGLAAVYGVLVMTKRDRDILLAFSFFIAMLALLLAAFKVLPTLELSGQILRTAGEFTIQNLYNSLHPLYYLTMLVPYLFGRHRIGYWGSEYPWGNWENFVYIGILPILFLPFALRWRNKLLGMFAIGLAVTSFLSLGRYWAPAAFVVRHLPFAASLSVVSKFTLFIHFFLAVLVAIGLHATMEDRGDRRVLYGFVGYALLLAVILFLGLRTDKIGRLQPAGRPAPSPDAVRFAQRSLGQARFLFGLSTAVVVVLLVSGKRRALRWVLPVYALDLLITASEFNPIDNSAGPASVHFPDNAIVHQLREDPTPFRVANLSTPSNISMVRSVETLSGYHTIETIVYHDMAPLFDQKNKAFLDLMNVKYTLWEQSSTLPGFVRVIPGLFRNPTVMERVAFVPSFKYAETKEEMAVALTSPAFDPRREVFLYRSTPLPTAFASRLPAPAAPGKARVRITRYRPTKVSVEVESPEPGFLLFSQPRYPGWQARIDGKQEPLLPADLSIYALPIERGSHKVEFVFRSRPLFFGFLLAGATALLLVLCFALPRARPVLFTPFNEWFQPSAGNPRDADRPATASRDS